MKRLLCILLFVLTTLGVSGCKQSKPSETGGMSSGRLQVVVSLFPLYDFARAIGGDKADVTLLLPPGLEPHSYEPKPDDMILISKANLFIYTNRYMEPWADKVVSGVVSGKGPKIIDAGADITYLPAADHDGAHEGHGHHEQHADHDHHHGEMDPHIWLDFENAQRMVRTMAAAFTQVDQANAAYYRTNGDELIARLVALDNRYREVLRSCQSRKLIHGGHYAFGYLAKRYNLEYHALSGVSAEAEASPARMLDMLKTLKQSGSRSLFAEELLSPRLTETLAREAKVDVLMLHGAHNLSKDDFNRGVTFIELMDRNLAQLQKGLGCVKK